MIRKILLALLIAITPLAPLASDREFDCLVRNVYYESRGESREGKLAVALVTLNRAEHERFPKSICGVVFQKNQFSWTTNYKKITVNAIQWQESKDAAMEAFMNRQIIGTFSATHFHNKNVNPRWRLKRVATIGNHYFYR